MPVADEMIRQACQQLEAELNHPIMQAALAMPVDDLLALPADPKERMAALGALMASCMPDPMDDDGCENDADWCVVCGVAPRTNHAHYGDCCTGCAREAAGADRADLERDERD